MTGAARNTVRRFQREGHHGRAWRAIEANLEAFGNCFTTAGGTVRGSVKNLSHF